MVDIRTKLCFSALCCALSPVGVSAQSRMGVVTPGGVMPASAMNAMEPADRLAMNLRLLSQNPYDVTALTQAGESALAVGDANAAISFLARAEELSPASGRIKASLASALVQLERPTEAMRLFVEAQGLGVSEQSFAKDRGLAYDLRGENKRAQRDYSLALRSGPDEEVTRRLAMSLGISGDKEDALRQLEPLIRRRDQGAWRARAFILAMNGDVRGAEKIADQVVPPAMMSSFSTFMRRLASLSPAERAHAVNFGSMPSQEVRYAASNTSDPFRPIDAGAADALSPAAPADVSVLDNSRVRSSREPRRRPGRDEVALASNVPVFLTKPRVEPPTPAPAPIAPPATRTATVTPTFVDTRVGRRVGERLGPVDPARLPEVLRPTASDAAAAPRPVMVVATGMTSLPAPSSSRAGEILPSAPAFPTPAPALASATPAPVVKTAAVSPTPALFELPSPKPVSPVSPAPALVAPAPAPVVPAPAVSPPIGASAASAAAVVAHLPTPPVTSTASPSFPAALTPAILNPAPAPAPAIIAPLVPAPLVVAPPKADPLVAAPVAAPAAAPVVATLAAPAPGFSEAITAPIPVTDAAASVITPLPAAPALIEPTTPETPALTPAAPVLAPTVTPVAPAPAGLASILSGITPEEESRGGPVLSDAEFRKARLIARRKAEADNVAETQAKAELDTKRKEEEERRRIAALSPQRFWVQIATGANRGGLSGTVKKLRDQAPDALKGLSAATVPYKATNRVLVGPFKTSAEARTTVNKLAKQGISATTFTSDAGQDVAKLSSH